MGLSAQQMLQNDPEYLARQMAQQEITKYQNFQNPQLGLAATSGALIGRGIGNLFVFLSSTTHRVAPIIDGNRYSLVGWFKLRPIENFKKTLL